MGIIDEIKGRVDIVEVASLYIPGLKKVGRNFRSVCPFHSEKTPSFYIFPENQRWHCFGACGTGGDVFSFIMKKEGVDFAEALRLLAQKAGVSLSSKYEEENIREVDKLKGINEAAAEYYHALLLKSPAAQYARSYLRQRGVSEKTVEEFQLGYSLDSWDSLHEQLTKKGYPDDDLVAAGLLVKKEQGRIYDRFRNRLIFPIQEISGRVIGFGARALDDSLPKYLNSPQTIIFDKSNSLYGIDRAKNAIKKQNLAVVVEGYMDVIIAHQYDFNNVIASLGTAITEKQMSIIKKITTSLTLALDADAAGEMATLRGIEVASHTFDQKVVALPTSQGLVKYENLLNADINVMVLPPGKDPDEVINENPTEWKRLVEEASPVIDYTFDLIISKLDLTNVKDRSSAVDQLLPIIDQIKDPVRQSHYLQKTTRLVGVNEQTLASTLKQAHLTNSKKGRGLGQPSKLVDSLSSSDPLAEYFLSLLIRYPKLRSYATDIPASHFEHSENRELFHAWHNTPDIDALRKRIDMPLQECLDRLLAKPIPPMSDEEQIDALINCSHRLHERWLKKVKAKEKILISDAQSEGSYKIEELEEIGISVDTQSNTQLLEVFLHERERKRKGREA